jgi:hypothetical protein
MRSHMKWKEYIHYSCQNSELEFELDETDVIFNFMNLLYTSQLNKKKKLVWSYLPL